MTSAAGSLSRLTPNGTQFVVFASEPYALASVSVQRRTDALPETSAYGSQSERHRADDPAIGWRK